MSPARWSRIKDLFSATLERPRAEQSGYLKEACGSDAELRGEVERLLDQQEASGLTSPAAGWLEAAARLELAPGTVIGRYRVESKLGEGGMGIVYQASDTQLRRPVAIKVIAPEHLLDSFWKHRLIREARAAALLNHPNIVTVHEIGSDGGVDFIVMEYVEGRPLGELIGGRALKLDEAM